MSFPILTSLIALPIAGALLLLLVRDDEAHESAIRRVALVVSVLVFAETLLLWAHFNPTSAEFQFVERHAWIPTFGISDSNVTSPAVPPYSSMTSASLARRRRISASGVDYSTRRSCSC